MFHQSFPAEVDQCYSTNELSGEHCAYRTRTRRASPRPQAYSPLDLAIGRRGSVNSQRPWRAASTPRPAHPTGSACLRLRAPDPECVDRVVKHSVVPPGADANTKESTPEICNKSARIFSARRTPSPVSNRAHSSTSRLRLQRQPSQLQSNRERYSCADTADPSILGCRSDGRCPHY